MKNQGVSLPPAILAALVEHLGITGSKLSVEQAIVQAIAQWQAQPSRQALPASASPLRGYQWKRVFLPESTQLRMFHLGRAYYAEVVGDAIVYQGRPLSPHQLVKAIAPGVRNAWLELSLRLPGSREWKRASTARREHEQAAQIIPPTPGDAMSAAAAAMSDALQAALALVKHTAGDGKPKNERRLDKQRRASDLMGEDCSFD